MAEFDVCAFLFYRWRTLLRWRNMWTILLFIFGSAVLIFLVGAVLLFIRQDWIPGALSTLATIVNGVGIKWIVDRRNEAVAEESEAKKDLLDKCGGQKFSAAGIQAAATAELAQAGTGTAAAEAALSAIEDKYKLLGWIR